MHCDFATESKKTDLRGGLSRHLNAWACNHHEPMLVAIIQVITILCTQPHQQHLVWKTLWFTLRGHQGMSNRKGSKGFRGKRTFQTQTFTVEAQVKAKMKWPTWMMTFGMTSIGHKIVTSHNRDRPRTTSKAAVQFCNANNASKVLKLRHNNNKLVCTSKRTRNILNSRLLIHRRRDQEGALMTLWNKLYMKSKGGPGNRPSEVMPLPWHRQLCFPHNNRVLHLKDLYSFFFFRGLFCIFILNKQATMLALKPPTGNSNVSNSFLINEKVL